MLSNITQEFYNEKNDSLEITINEIFDNTIELVCDGFIDTYNSSFFLRKVNKLLGSYNNVIINCEKLSFVSSTGIGAFTNIYKACKDRNGVLIFININNKITEILKLLGFDHIFIIKQDLEEAKNYIKNGCPNNNFMDITKNCPECNKIIKVYRPGRFRCSKCKCLINISSDGDISTL